MHKPSIRQRQMIERLRAAGCAMGGDMSAAYPLLVTGFERKPRGGLFRISGGLGVLLPLRIFAIEPIEIAGYDLLNDAKQSIPLIAFCKQHQRYCFDHDGGPDWFPGRVLNRRVDQVGRVKPGQRLDGILLAKMMTDTLPLQGNLELHVNLQIRDQFGSSFEFPASLETLTNGLLRKMSVMKLGFTAGKDGDEAGANSAKPTG